MIIPTLNEGNNLRKTILSLQATTNGDYEIIVVDNGSTDGSSDFIETESGDSRIRLFKTDRLGVANSRNFGANKAEGEYVFFIDAHVLFQKGWIEPLIEILNNPEIGLVVPAVSAWGNSQSKGFGMRWCNTRLDVIWLSQRSTIPYQIPMAAGLCMGFRKEYFFDINGFDAGMKTYGSEDLEICLRNWLLGNEVMIVPQIEVSHLFRPRHPYSVNWVDVIYNMLRTVLAHFNNERAERVVTAISSLPSFNKAYRLVMDSNINEVKKHIEQRRKHDDNWFFNKFDIPF